MVGLLHLILLRAIATSGGVAHGRLWGASPEETGSCGAIVESRASAGTATTADRRRWAELRHRISVTARELGLKRFLTLTLDPEKLGEGEDLFWYIREVWRKFRVYLKRRLGRSVSFISVMEAHKLGRPHLHVLLDQYVEQRWISEAWDRLGGGRIVFIKRVDDLSGVGWYLGKYLTKDMRLVGGSGTRRYSTSRNIRLMPARGGTGWIRAPARFDELLSAAGGPCARWCAMDADA